MSVRVEPLGLELELRPGETLIEAAWREGYHWPTVCFGQAECTACNVVVVAGADNLSEVGPEESAALELLRSTGLPNVAARRLACRLEARGPAVVEKLGVRPTAETETTR
jgi:2Fe-2S ferredoxin